MKVLVHDYVGHPFQVELSRELADRGHDVTHAYAGGLITPRGALQKRADDPENFASVEVPMSPDYRSNKYSFVKRRGFEVSYGKELARLIERLRPDCVISSNNPTEPQCALVAAAEAVRAPVITWLQDFYSVAVTKLLRKKLPVVGEPVSAWYRHLDRRCLRKSAAVVSITGDFIPLLREFGVPESKVTVIPNWAPLGELPLRPRENAWRAKLGLGDAFTFLYSGTLAMKHNPDLLRQLAAHFREDPNVRVVVITEGPGGDYLQKKKSEEALNNLILLPFQPFEDMPDVLASSDVLLTVLEADAGVFSVPSKVLTYLCAQRALLGAMPSENLATRTVLEQKAGLVVGPEDGTGFVAAAERLRNDSALRQACAAAGRSYAEREFNVGRISDRFEEVIAKTQG